ncbi:MAG: peptidase, partial [Nitrosopumilus sp. CG10_big_fil_rev_8_21_14_0_10_33_7]
MFSQFVFAEVFIPSQEYVGYYDDERVYTVGGNVKNQNDFAVIPTISVTVIDGENTFTKTITHVTIPPRTDIPFKIKLHEITGNNPVLLEPKLKFVKTEKEPITITI